jgi:hypothetical protein
MQKIIFIIFSLTIIYGIELQACSDSSCFKQHLLLYNSKDTVQDNELKKYFTKNKELAFGIIMDELRNTQDSAKMFYFPVLISQVLKYSEFYRLFQNQLSKDSIKRAIILVMTTKNYLRDHMLREEKTMQIDSMPLNALLEICKYGNISIFFYCKYTPIVCSANLSSTSHIILNYFVSYSNLFTKEPDEGPKDKNQIYHLSDLSPERRIDTLQKWMNKNADKVVWDTYYYSYRIKNKPVIFSKDDIIKIEKKKAEIDDYCHSFFKEEYEKYKFVSIDYLDIEPIINDGKVDTLKLSDFIISNRYNTIHSILKYLTIKRDSLLMVEFARILPSFIAFDTLLTFIEVSELLRSEKDMMEIFSFSYSGKNFELFMKTELPNCFLNSLVRAVGNDTLDILHRLNLHDPEKLSNMAEFHIQLLLRDFPELKARRKFGFHEKYPEGLSRMFYYQLILNKVFYDLEWDSKTLTFKKD